MGKTSFGTELIRMRSLAREFAEAIPALAPLLGGLGGDPDVERLLEAAAFQNGLLGRRLGSDFPELVLSLAGLLLPHYLRPYPASTIVRFAVVENQEAPVLIPSGTVLASNPVDGAPCRFATTGDLEVHPLEISDTDINRGSAGASRIQLSVALHGIPLSRWQPQCLRFFLAGDHASATDMFQTLMQNVKRIVVAPAAGGSGMTLPPDSLRPAGFEQRECLIPYPPHAFPAYRLLQEYFNVPEKFLFFELAGWERWQDRGEGRRFTINIELDGHAGEESGMGRVAFVPNAVPAVNLFARNADPVRIDHRAGRYLVRPNGPDRNHYRVFSVDRVTGHSNMTGRQRDYAALELFGPAASSEPAYQTLLERSPLSGGYDAYLRLAFPEGAAFLEDEILSLELACTNGTLPESLRIGDIRFPEPGMPPGVAFSNLTPVNPGVPPPLGPGLLRRLAIHLRLNLVTLGTAENLRALLRLYLHQDSAPDRAPAANLKRLDGIEGVEIMQSESMVEGIPIRGSAIRLKLREDHFAGPGDLYLFGCVLDRFLAEYASINCFTRLTVDELLKGDRRQWPLRQE